MKPRIPRLRLASLSGAEIFPLAVPGESRTCNPSIAISDQGVFCIIRAVNYDLDPHGRVLIPPPGGFQSSHWLVELDSGFRITRHDLIDDSAVGIDRQSLNRLEDCRLFRWKGAWWFTATWVLGDFPLVCQIALCRLEGSKVVEWHLLPSPAGASLEKNWMPCVDGDRLKWIYWIDPVQVLTYRGDGQLSLERLDRYGRLERWSGSSPLVRYRGKWLGVIHLSKQWRYVTAFEHRLVELSDDFRLQRMSRPFTFEGNEVEYCAGLCVTETHAVLSYGVHDREAYLMRLELSELDAILQPVRVPYWLSILVADAWRAVRPWIRQPRRKWLAVIRPRGFGILGLCVLGGIVISAARYVDLAV